MILQPCTVELTKIHYYDKNEIDSNLNRSSTCEKSQNNFNKNIIIKKNIFGHKWVLKLNENSEDKTKDKTKSKVRIIIYVLVFCSIIVAVGFGIFFSIDKSLYNLHNYIKPHRNISKQIAHSNSNFFIIPESKNITQTPISVSTEMYKIKYISPNASYCFQCDILKSVCLKINETERPNCLQAKNENDPTGCGGWCEINKQYCQILDTRNRVYQCSILRTILKCPNNTFNCGNMCIKEEKQCDGKLDCSNGSDEKDCDCNLETHFHCGNKTSCLENSKRCDHILDCWDKSDEENCNLFSECSEEEITCFDGQCIPKTLFCDGKYDCIDKSDEPNGC